MKIGLLGTGHLGRIHLKCISMIGSYQPVGFYDPDPDIRHSVQEEYGWYAFDSAEALIAAADVVDIPSHGPRAHRTG